MRVESAQCLITTVHASGLMKILLHSSSFRVGIFPRKTVLPAPARKTLPLQEGAKLTWCQGRSFYPQKTLERWGAQWSGLRNSVTFCRKMNFLILTVVKMAKGRRVMLTMQDRMDFLKDLETSSVTNVAEKYKIHLKTIRRIQENVAEINNFANKGVLERHRKHLRSPTHEELEQRLFVWYTERKSTGHAVSDAHLLEKAAELKELGSCSNFKVSEGWLVKFKRRYHIRLVYIDDETASADPNVANSFVSDFQKYIQEQNIQLENIYNMDETGLLWKALPLKTSVLVPETEECTSVDKLRKDRVTIGVCANAAGTHKTMPLVIHKYRKPRALRQCMESLPVVYKAQANSCMNQRLFIDWFENHFKTEVRRYHLENRLCGKVILLVDDCAIHQFPSNYEHDDQFQVKYLPSNVTSLIQPMGQGVIEKLKRCFRNKLTQHLIAKEYGIEDFYKKSTIKDCLDMVSESWDDLTCNNIKNAWKKMISNIQVETEGDIIAFEIQQAWLRISEQGVTIEDIENYLTASSEEERKLYRILEKKAAEEGDQEMPAEEEDQESAAEEGDKESVAKEGDKESVAKEGDKEIVAEEGDKERSPAEEYQGYVEKGIKLHPKIRKDFENAFKDFERLKKYIPRSARCHLDGLKLKILGDTTSKGRELP